MPRFDRPASIISLKYLKGPVGEPVRGVRSHTGYEVSKPQRARSRPVRITALEGCDPRISDRPRCFKPKTLTDGVLRHFTLS